MRLLYDRPLWGLMALGLCVLVPAAASAQVIERHLPQVPKTGQNPAAIPDLGPLEATDPDARPIGPALKALVLLSGDDPVRALAVPGIDLSSVKRLKADQAATQAVLQPFLGQPLSLRLISEIKAAVVMRYRALGYPLVAVTTPEQEISSGTLQIRVVEFVTGQVTTEGAKGGDEHAILSHIHLRPGAPISTAELSDELGRLNRYPFRQIQAIFSPGAAVGTTDLSLKADYSKPWQVYGGYSNAGAQASGRDRYYVGGMVGGILGHDSVLSYQGTVSRDALMHNGHHPRYMGQSLNYVLPVGERGQIEANLNRVDINSTADPFTVRFNIVEGVMGYRFDLRAKPPQSGRSDIRFGVEAKHETSLTLFDDTLVYSAVMDTFQAFLGFHHESRNAYGASAFDIVGHISPGGMNANNSRANVGLYTQGRLKDARYSYINVDYSISRNLALGLALNSHVIGQYSPNILPNSEQSGVGGAYLVRGYSQDDGAFDASLILRNELRAAPVAFSQMQVRPYGFVDAGVGWDNDKKRNFDLMSAGLGADASLGRNARVTLDAAYVIRSGPSTPLNTWTGHVALNLSY